MEKIIKKEKKFKVIEDGTKESVVYIGLDGVEYESEIKCLDSDEQFLKNEKVNNIIRVYSNEIEEYPNAWYRPKTQEELDFLLKRFGLNKKLIATYGIIVPNEFIGFVCYNGGDYDDRYYIYTLEYVKKDIKDFLNSLPNN